jgi:hypothetical protein
MSISQQERALPWTAEEDDVPRAMALTGARPTNISPRADGEGGTVRLAPVDIGPVNAG